MVESIRVGSSQRLDDEKLYRRTHRRRNYRRGRFLPIRKVRVQCTVLIHGKLAFAAIFRRSLRNVPWFRSPSSEDPEFLLDSSVTQAVRSNINLHNLYDNIDAVNEDEVVQVLFLAAL